MIHVVAPSSGGGGGAGSASGSVSSDINPWVLSHGLGFDPAGFRFWDQNGDEMEPDTITYTNPNVSLATWLAPCRGTWLVS